MTGRQEQILKAIVEQYAEIAAPVGSVLLARLFDVSSATIRNEMAALEEMGLIYQPHTSAGRVPTDKGYRAYVNNLTLESGENRQVKAIESRVSENRSDKAIRSAVDSLVELTHNFGFATIGEELYVAGIANLFAQPEFVNTVRVHKVAKLLDNLELWLREAAPNEPLNVFIGSENAISRDSGVSLIVSRFHSPLSDRSYIGVLGPTRQSYLRVMNLVRQTGEMLERIL
ncbi:MAG: transcriptional regulator [Candidatus Nomurabacteria bacterium]|jgi:heat-inducible transcriptional repressor|nr:transcriptional regulator [Candidatus Nomurabacteria bacterium]